mmetsp:Transcript_46855/g.101736  ORF Transcript_46855/g.101736 Transcript_46855/m.101736 type:complete len:261 (+) Transcript_46855:663-1445(+)
MAINASAASLAVASFLAFSAARSSLDSFCVVRSSTSSFSSMLIRSAPWVMAASVSSMVAVRPSMPSCNFTRVSLFVPSSLSHQPFCSDSSLASFSSLVIMSSMSFFTLAKGSDEETLTASMSSCWLRSRRLSLRRKADSVLRTPCGSVASPRSCARAVPELFCISSGRCAWAEPSTSGEERISTAFWITSSSSARSFCFSAKDSCFSAHSTLSSLWNCSSSLRSDSASTSCCFFCAADFFFPCSTAVLSATSASEFRMKS